MTLQGLVKAGFKVARTLRGWVLLPLVMGAMVVVACYASPILDVDATLGEVTVVSCNTGFDVLNKLHPEISVNLNTREIFSDPTVSCASTIQWKWEINQTEVRFSKWNSLAIGYDSTGRPIGALESPWPVLDSGAKFEFFKDPITGQIDESRATLKIKAGHFKLGPGKWTIPITVRHRGITTGTATSSGRAYESVSNKTIIFNAFDVKMAMTDDYYGRLSEVNDYVMYKDEVGEITKPGGTLNRHETKFPFMIPVYVGAIGPTLFYPEPIRISSKNGRVIPFGGNVVHVYGGNSKWENMDVKGDKKSRSHRDEDMVASFEGTIAENLKTTSIWFAGILRLQQGSLYGFTTKTVTNPAGVSVVKKLYGPVGFSAGKPGIKIKFAAFPRPNDIHMGVKQVSMWKNVYVQNMLSAHDNMETRYDKSSVRWLPAIPSGSIWYLYLVRNDICNVPRPGTLAPRVDAPETIPPTPVYAAGRMDFKYNLTEDSPTNTVKIGPTLFQDLIGESLFHVNVDFTRCQLKDEFCGWSALYGDGMIIPIEEAKWNLDVDSARKSSQQIDVVDATGHPAVLSPVTGGLTANEISQLILERMVDSEASDRITIVKP